jgi:hypothetical protein
LLYSIADRPAPVLADKVFKTFRRMCGWAVERGIIDQSRCEGISESRLKEAGVQQYWGYLSRPIFHREIIGQTAQELPSKMS